MRMFIFILMGSQVDFSLMNRYLVGGVIVIIVFMLVARPITVFLCALPDRRAKWSFNEMLFMCWTRETGVIPAALAGLLLGMKAPGGADHRLCNLHRHSYDHRYSGHHYEVAGKEAGVAD